ncbi:uncharacterized protein EI97DRAFT_181682 [Westerdykella ornata]|uniref:Uncharacterized protein n=1 Tax=Westerdykella ornata TaxID=318751 RepID=A0A6A6JTN0_WESOR|nr:uncharacterized protein EI97DRAFT_181682 [Westerdykella ornata]KAF2279615.1 hypothetical protein EI97DRAFT_181682 [Westerdykella ornata]
MLIILNVQPSYNRLRPPLITTYLPYTYTYRNTYPAYLVLYPLLLNPAQNYTSLLQPLPTPKSLSFPTTSFINPLQQPLPPHNHILQNPTPFAQKPHSHAEIKHYNYLPYPYL